MDAGSRAGRSGGLAGTNRGGRGSAASRAGNTFSWDNSAGFGSGSGGSGLNSGDDGVANGSNGEAVRVAVIVGTNTLDTDEGIGVFLEVFRNVPDVVVTVAQVITQDDGSNDLGVVSVTSQDFDIDLAELRSVLSNVPGDGAGTTSSALSSSVGAPDVNVASLSRGKESSSNRSEEESRVHLCLCVCVGRFVYSGQGVL